VIVILGVIAVVAVPLYADLRREARVASISGLAAKLDTLVGTAFARGVMAGGSAVSLPSGATATFSSLGSMTNASFLAALDSVLNVPCVTYSATLKQCGPYRVEMTPDAPSSANSGQVELMRLIDASTDPWNCRIVYASKHALSEGWFGPMPSQGKLMLMTSGC
jgi:hypothetical protein